MRDDLKCCRFERTLGGFDNNVEDLFTYLISQFNLSLFDLSGSKNE